MRLRIDRTSPLSIHQQLRQQIIFQISTGEAPIGYIMPSLDQLQRDLKVCRNTIDKLYDELVEQRWLYREKGKRAAVAYPKPMTAEQAGDSVDSLIDRLVIAAKAQGISLEQITGQIRDKASTPPPDHFLVVAPESGIGKVIQYEVHKLTGHRVVSHSIGELRRRPALLNQAALLVPAYLADLLDFIPLLQRASMTVLVYSPFGGYIEAVRKLQKPSIIGMISISGPGMKTMDGVFAEAIGSRHELIPFFLEWPPEKPESVIIKRLTAEELPPDIDVRRIALESLAADGDGGASLFNDDWHANLRVATQEDIRAVDVLFCDSITYNFVQHPNRVTYRLLSEQTLQTIATVKLAPLS